MSTPNGAGPADPLGLGPMFGGGALQYNVLPLETPEDGQRYAGVWIATTYGVLCYCFGDKDSLDLADRLEEAAEWISDPEIKATGPFLGKRGRLARPGGGGLYVATTDLSKFDPKRGPGG